MKVYVIIYVEDDLESVFMCCANKEKADRVLSGLSKNYFIEVWDLEGESNEKE